jgi:hypothetical protein
VQIGWDAGRDLQPVWTLSGRQKLTLTADDAVTIPTALFQLLPITCSIATTAVYRQNGMDTSVKFHWVLLLLCSTGHGKPAVLTHNYTTACGFVCAINI